MPDGKDHDILIVVVAKALITSVKMWVADPGVSFFEVKQTDWSLRHTRWLWRSDQSDRRRA
jgi:hypothetical protein